MKTAFSTPSIGRLVALQPVRHTAHHTSYVSIFVNLLNLSKSNCIQEYYSVITPTLPNPNLQKKKKKLNTDS